MTDDVLTVRLCELLGGIEGWSWSPDEPAPAGAVAVFYGSIPDSPDRAVGVRVYGGSDDPLVYAPRRRVQVLVRGGRGAPAGADVLAGEAFAVLQNLSRRAGISHVQRTSFGPLGADGNGRQERSDNYSVTLDNLEVTP